MVQETDGGETAYCVLGVRPYTGDVFGISGGEFIVLLLVIMLVVGPQRLPEYTSKLTQIVRQLRVMLDNAKEQIAKEVGPELSDLNLSDLDPRNYDPRKIVRDALGEDLDAIRKDLANPFESVFSTATQSSKEAAEAVNASAASRSQKSLTDMIKDEAEKARQTSTTATDGAAEQPADATESTDATSTQPTTDDAEQAVESPSQTAQASSDADTTTSLTDGNAETTSNESDTGAQAQEREHTSDNASDTDGREHSRDSGPVAEPQNDEETSVVTSLDAELAASASQTDAPTAPTDNGVQPDQTGQTDHLTEQDTPVPSDTAKDTDAPADAAASADAPEHSDDDAENPERRALLTEAVETVTGLADNVAELMDIPSTLLSEDTLPDTETTVQRPLSPRDIVRAAHAAARTRPEAAAAVVDTD